MISFSCLIPLYNDEKYIGRCIDSILKNNYDNIEILVINDGSTDNSKKICEKYQKITNKIRLINKANSGVCDTRNLLIKEFTGDYAIFIDSDDYISNNFFEEIVKIIDKYNKPDLITYDYNRVYEKNNIIVNSFSNDNTITLYDSYLASKEYLLGNSDFSMVLWRRCYRRDILKKILFEKDKLPEDLSTAFEIYSNSSNIVHVSKSYYYYFIKEDGLSFQNTQIDYINLLNITQKLYDEEKNFFCNDSKMLKVVNSIYINYLLTVYCKFYYSKKNNIRDSYLNIIDNLISKNNLSIIFKTKIALLIYRINKKIFCYILKIKIERNIKGR